MKLYFLTISCLLFIGCSGGGGSSSSPSPGPATNIDDLTISSGFQCSKVSGGFFFSYRSTVFTSGDRWVGCEVADSSNQSSSSEFYKSGLGGTTTAYCSLVFDSDGTPTSGFWEFTANPTKQAVYSDSGSGINGTTITFASGDCSLF